MYDSLVKLRLEGLGCPLSEGEEGALDYQIGKARAALLADIHQPEVPEGLMYVLADMAAAGFLLDKLASGRLEIEGMDFSAAAKSITEGDVSVTFASGGEDSPESRFLSRLNAMAHPSEGVLSRYRRLSW